MHAHRASPLVPATMLKDDRHEVEPRQPVDGQPAPKPTQLLAADTRPEPQTGWPISMSRSAEPPTEPSPNCQHAEPRAGGKKKGAV